MTLPLSCDSVADAQKRKDRRRPIPVRALRRRGFRFASHAGAVLFPSPLPTLHSDTFTRPCLLLPRVALTAQTIQKEAPDHRTCLMYPWRLLQLANQAVRHLRMYDPIDASVAVAALGELNYDLSPSTTAFLVSLTPALPHCDATQLTRVLVGLSRLRVAHYMLVSHILKLFLAALTRDGGSAKVPTSPVHAGSSLRCAAGDQLAKVASMVRVVQVHHTQRTVRAFLAAAERALAPIMTSGGGAHPTSAQHGKRDGGASSTSPASARQMVLELLFILEVYVNARVRVAAPHTPAWLLHMISRAPWAFFSLSELLHVYSRLFPAAAAHRRVACAAGVSAARLVQNTLTEHILGRARSTKWVDLWSCRRASPVTGEQDAEDDAWRCSGDFSNAAQVGCCVWEGLPPGERYALLRCVVWRLASQPLTQVRGAEANELVGLLTPALFCLLAAEFGAQMRGPALRWWMGALPRSAMEGGRMANAAASRARCEGAAREAVQLCIALLQLLHIEHAKADEVASSLGCAAADCLADDSAGSRQVSEVLVAVQRLVTCLHRVASLAGDGAGHEGEWELLTLLLDLHAPSSNPAGASFAHWLEAALQRSGDASHMWRCLLTAQRDARDALIRRWCNFWVNRRGAVVCKSSMAKKCRSDTLVRADRGNSAAPLCVGLGVHEWRLHWCIAHLLDAWLQRARQSRQLHICATLPLAHLTSRWFPFRQIWQGMLAETTAHLHGSDWSAATRGSPYPAMVLETDLLVIMADSLDPRRRARERSGEAQMLPSLISLADAISDSALPDALCTALEVAQAHDTDRPRQTLPCHAEAETQRERWRRRVWWSEKASASGTSMSLQAAQMLLLCALFHPSTINNTCIPADSSSPCRLPARWPYQILAVSLRTSASPQRPSAASHEPRESREREWGADGSQWEMQGDGETGAEYHAPGALTLFARANLTEPLPIPAISEPLPTKVSLFTCAKGLTNALMCSIEALVAWQWRSGMLALDTLRGRDDGVSALPPDLSGATATLYRIWYRDDTPVILAGGAFLAVKPLGDPNRGGTTGESADEPPGQPSARDTGVLVTLCEMVALLTRAAVPLNASGASLFAPSPAFSSDCVPAFKGGVASSSLCGPLPPFQPPMAAEALYAELCLRFWEHCRRLADVLARCAVSKPGSRGDEEAPACIKGAEALAIAGAVAWRRFSRHFSNASPSAKPSCSAHGLTAAQNQATKLLLPLIWRSAHCCTVESSPATSQMSKCRLPIRGVLSDLWRLQLFTSHIGGQLPLPAKCEPAQERLWWCLQAALSGAIPAGQQRLVGAEPSEPLEDQAALELAVSELRASLCQRHWLDSTAQGTQRPFSFLRDAILSMGADHGATPAVGGEGESSMTSPMAVYVQRLLPCHPFVLAGPRGMQVHLLCGVQLVVLTWMHVLLLECIAMYHPRLFSAPCTQQLIWVRSRLRTCKQELYLGPLSSASLQSEGAAPSTARCTGAEESLHSLLVMCLTRELDAAVSELMSCLRDPCIPA
ncbi:hypothetical protein LSCM1_03442 [Leishmania martiniquensis]|uniref:Uncharacterized protein n=1 Tax=Leishmania martiniquensis TaxID=1580590 RepID=A0A836GMQ2_9TRYP|nr:hypothetical protein LSCM1_03442 [Leishmania martiniquensis]